MTQVTLSLTKGKQAKALLQYLRTLDFVEVVSVLNDEEKEDIGMAALLKEADRTQKVSKSIILQKLKAQ